MANKPIVKQNPGHMKGNPLESLKDFGSSTAQNLGSSLKDLGGGMLDQLLGTKYGVREDESGRQESGRASGQEKSSPRSKK